MENSELVKIKKIINVIINLLEKNILNFDKKKENLTDRQKDLLQFLIGNKENVVSIITKLSTLLIKINSVTTNENQDYIELEKEDIKIIMEYINKQNKNENNK